MAPTMNNQVVIVDDHPAIRMTVRFLLEGEGYQIVGEAENGADALNLIPELQPGTLILDIGLPKIDGLTVISRLATLRIPVKIIVLTAQESDHIAIRCMKAGAHGFVNKQDDLCELINAIRAVSSGYSYFPERAFCLTRCDGSQDGEEELLKALSTRELRVLQQLAQGLSNKQIAERMLLSSKTISTYKTRLLVKLNASTLLDLYDLAKRNGLAEH
ncbi:two-component system response regulator EvgA [Pseudomonas frederiksbergensis]